MAVFSNDSFSGPGGVRGRLAPSPTGFLHLGNAWSFLAAWLGVRSQGGKLVLRIEDIDPARARGEYVDALVEDLTWLGLDWDEGPAASGLSDADPHGHTQSLRGDIYTAALAFLERKGAVYPCYCTRKELRDLAGAPHVDDAGAPYPGVCRRLSPRERKEREASGRRAALRLACPPETPWSFEDGVYGPRSMTLAGCGGDFALRRSDGVFAYQLAVVVDDIAMGVTQVVRGRDILASTPRQMYLYSLFDREPPAYSHVPLILDHGGERLAKRHASLTLRALREADVVPATILGWLAASVGLRNAFAPILAHELARGFSFNLVRPVDVRLPPEPTAFFLRLQTGARKA